MQQKFCSCASAHTIQSTDLPCPTITQPLSVFFGWAHKGYLIQRFSRMRIGTARVLSESWANDMQFTNKNAKAKNQILRLACDGVCHAYDTFEAFQCFHSFC
jgi:hypothetical protein